MSVNEAAMAVIPEKVDPLSEMLLLSTYGNTKNILMTAIELEGPFDEEASRLAFRQALQGFPHILSCIGEVKIHGLHHLLWKNRPDLPIPMTISEMNGGPDRSPLLDDLLTHLRPRLDRDWNLFEEMPFDIQVVRTAPERHILVTSFHHVASDAATAAEFGKEFFVRYHQIKTGKRPEWASEAHAISSSAKRKVRVRPSTWRDAMTGMRQTLMNLLDKPVLPAGSGSPMDSGEHQIKRVLTEEQTAHIGMRATRHAVSPIDLFTACGEIAVDRWNEARNIPPGLLTCSMTVNSRGRFGSSDRPNNGSVIFFRSTPEERKNLARFCRTLAVTRINHFRKQMDIKYMRDVQRMINSLRLLPFRLRRRIVHQVVNRHQFSIAVTMLGALWPKTRNGKPSSETALTHSADLTIREVHGIGYKLLSSNHVLLIVYAFKNRLNLVLACSAVRFTRQEAEAFTDLLVSTLIDYPMSPIR
jgi:hypothetical protein